MTPITETVKAPADVGALKASLADAIEDVAGYRTAERGSNPGLAAIKELLEGPDQIPITQAENMLGAIKGLHRDPLMREQKAASARLAAIAGRELNTAIEAAAERIGVTDDLTAARALVRRGHAIEKPVVRIKTRDEAASWARRLLQPGDANVGLAQEVAVQAGPTRMRSIGRAAWEERLAKAGHMDQFERLGDIEGFWRGLGPKTKDLFYGPELSAEIDRFLLVARKVKDEVNPSGSAFSYFTMSRVAAGTTAVGMAIAGNPVPLGLWLLEEMTAGGLSKVLNNPRATRALTRGFQTRPGTTAAKAALAEIMAVAGKDALPKYIPSPHDPAKARQAASTAKP